MDGTASVNQRLAAARLQRQVQRGALNRMTEAQLTDVVLQAAKLYGWRVTHFRPARTAKGWVTPLQGDPGFPDLVLARAGVVLIAELKVGRNKARPDQVAWAEAIGATCYRLWRDTDLRAILEELRNHRPSDTGDLAARSPSA